MNKKKMIEMLSEINLELIMNCSDESNDEVDTNTEKCKLIENVIDLLISEV